MHEFRPNSYIGTSLLRREDLRLVRGRGEFVGDISLPGMLHAAILRSAFPHGKITRLDVTRACAMAGVHTVIRASDIGRATPRIPMRQERLESLARFEQPVLAEERVRYVGEPVAIVVADSRALAEDALELIEFSVEPAPVSTGLPRERTSFEAVREQLGNDIALTLYGRLGDADAALKKAHYVRSETFKVQRHSAMPMETRGLVASLDEDGSLSVYGAVKVPFWNRKLLAAQLGLPLEKIRMHEIDVGGGFGVRGEFYPEDFLIPFAAMHVGRPVKWIEDRREHFVSTNHAREMECELAIACDENGHVVGLRGEAWCDVGAYLRTNAMTQPRNVAQVISGPYNVPNIDMTAVLLMSNKAPAGTYRGPGRFEADFFRERLFDMAAADLGIDRVEFRRKNLITGGQMPYLLPTIQPYNSTTECDSGDYVTPFDRCLKEIRWNERQTVVGAPDEQGHYLGLGIGCYIESGASGPRENVRIILEVDETFTVYTGSSGVGQGIETTMAQIAADSLEVPVEKINTIRHGSTDYLEEGFGTYGSRSIVMGGSALVDAATNLRRVIREAAASHFEISADEVKLSGTRLVVKGVEHAVADVVRLPLSATGTYASEKRTYSYGTHAAYVQVDIESGQVKLLDYVAVDDIGRAINPDTLNGQTLGGIVQGLGGAMLESLDYDEDGQCLTGTFADYLQPSATDFPNIRNIGLEICPSPNNPLGAKGGGEGGIIPVGGVMANAVASALSRVNAQPKELPLTPWYVWEMAQGLASGLGDDKLREERA